MSISIDSLLKILSESWWSGIAAIVAIIALAIAIFEIRLKLKKPKIVKEENTTNQRIANLDNQNVTELNITNQNVDELYSKAVSKVLKTYNDAKLSQFAVQVYPFGYSDKVILYFTFYSKWANKLCEFRFSKSDLDGTHVSPDYIVEREDKKKIFRKLPWKEDINWMEFIKLSYSKITPFSSSAQHSYYILYADSDVDNEYNWRIVFTDKFIGKDYNFYWKGGEINDKTIKVS